MAMRFCRTRLVKRRFSRRDNFATGEGQPEVGGSKSIVHRQRQFRRPHKKQAGGRQQAAKFDQHLLLAGAVKIDQQVAAKNEIVSVRPGQIMFREDVASLEIAPAF